MNIRTFIEEKIFYIIFQFFYILLLTFFLYFANVSYLIIIPILLLLLNFLYLIISYVITKRKYENIINTIDSLEGKYLAAEVLTKPTKIINKAYFYALKEACKSMNDKISQIELERQEYQEYIESFVHEIKTPISALSLTFDNTKNQELKAEIKKIDNLVEQMLFYARSDTTENDYFIKPLQLSDLIHEQLLNYKESFLKKAVRIQLHNLDYTVYTDEKWIQFIISQIIQNALKYFNKKENILRITAQKKDHNIIVSIEDNGCGISPADLPRVFEKSFTGSNRKKEYSTGIGLYLAKKLSQKLGIGIDIKSQKNKSTTVLLTFPKTNIYHP